MPGDTPHRETALRQGELITGIDVPVTDLAAGSAYLKVRDRATFEFAVVSVAAALRTRGRVVQDVRLAFGGVGTRPWRDTRVEAALRGLPLTGWWIARAACSWSGTPSRTKGTGSRSSSSSGRW